MESNYDIKAWAGDTTLGKRVFNFRFRMLGRELPGWKMLKAVSMHEDRALVEMTYLWENKDAPGQQLVRVNVGERADWRAAQKHLLGMLENCMRPDIPRGTGKFAGDVEFIAREPVSDILAAIQFSRGNIAVSINSAGPVTVDVSEFAAVIDRMLTAPADAVPFLRAAAKSVPPKTVLVKGKVGVPLVKDLKKTGDGWLKVIIPDGELRRKGDALVYVAPQPGKKTVKIFSIGTGAAPRGKK